ncbi:MAG: regulatory protein RecX [Alphaproteobacteria bacterium]|nr:regulatory protein RecX [Alphaproteobacteria bacterium]
MFSAKTTKSAPKKPSKARLRNIALYYLERFETSEDNLRAVLRRRIDKYAFFDKEYNPMEAYAWADEVVEECSKQNFVNDERFAGFKINSYLNAGKPRRYIEQKLKQKGIDEQTIDRLFENTDYSELDTALNFAKKKKIGRFRADDEARIANRQKDLGTLVRAGFDFEIAKEVLDDE